MARRCDGAAGVLSRRGPVWTLVLAAVLLIAGCGDDPVVRGVAAYQPSMVPISIAIDTTGHVMFDVSPKIVTPLGKVTLRAGLVQGRQDPAADETQLVIHQTINDRDKADAWRINTGRKLRVQMNGRFVAEIEPRRFIIYAAPGSTIRIVDISPKPLPRPTARGDVEKFELYETSDDTYLDLEKSEGGKTPDLAYDHASGRRIPSVQLGLRAGSTSMHV